MAQETSEPAVLDPAVLDEAATETELARRYHLVLLDDDDHTYHYVIEMLGRVFRYERDKAYAIACVVDGQGQAVVETAGYDQVTQHQQQIHSYGPDRRIEQCKGSMSAVVEESP